MIAEEDSVIIETVVATINTSQLLVTKILFIIFTTVIYY